MNIKTVCVVGGGSMGRQMALNTAKHDFEVYMTGRVAKGRMTQEEVYAIANEAYWLVENGYCSFEDVDIACEKGAGQKMGPFRSKDLTGIDLNFKMMQEKYDKTGEKPLGYDLFKEQYDKGRYGRKTGHGFYDYE